MSHKIEVNWLEDTTAVILARITASDGSGAATGVNGEGNWLQQADLSTVTCKVFDITGQTVTVSTPTVTISSDVKDTPITSSALWTQDTTGYNFIHTIANTYFPSAGHRYRVEYKFTTTGGTVFHLVAEGVAESILQS